MKFWKTLLGLAAALVILVKTNFIFEFITKTASDWKSDWHFDMWQYSYHDYSGVAWALGIAVSVLLLVEWLVKEPILKALAIVLSLIFLGWLGT